MKEFFTQHFNPILLSVLIFFFAGCAMWLLKHGAPEDGFKWASGLSGAVVGALLMLMRTANPNDGTADKR